MDPRVEEPTAAAAAAAMISEYRDVALNLGGALVRVCEDGSTLVRRELVRV